MNAVTTARAAEAEPVVRASRLAMVVAASSAGTVFEWYDFFIFGSLAAIIGRHFFAGVGESQG